MGRRLLRSLIAATAWLLAAAAPGGGLPDYPVVRAGVPLSFPRDYGAHPAFRTEWWYVTGWLRTQDGKDLGFQVTFFRTRPAIDQRNPSAFAPKQILFAHAALSDPSIGHLLHDQRAARAGFGLAEASATDADLRLDDWSFRRTPNGHFATVVRTRDFDLDLNLTPAQPILLQGLAGYSRKGPLPSEASYYFSAPHLSVTGAVTRGGGREAVTGQAWLDREWSSSLLAPGAVGWDWLGLNLDDGGALTAFQVRDSAGRAVWAGGTLRGADGSVIRLGPQDVQFSTLRRWRSPRTSVDYPVERIVSATIAGRTRRWRLKPLFDDQELDSRIAGGPVYWEGAVRSDAGQGYLELTGYAAPLKL